MKSLTSCIITPCILTSYIHANSAALSHISHAHILTVAKLCAWYCSDTLMISHPYVSRSLPLLLFHCLILTKLSCVLDHHHDATHMLLCQHPWLVCCELLAIVFRRTVTRLLMPVGCVAVLVSCTFMHCSVSSFL